LTGAASPSPSPPAVLLVAFGSLEFIEGQIVVKYAVSLIFGVPLVFLLRRYMRPS
jgi:hypothetical protein